MYTVERMIYTIELPSNIGDKLTYISTEGDGTKVLSYTGEYIPIQKGYRFLTEDEVADAISHILGQS